MILNSTKTIIYIFIFSLYLSCQQNVENKKSDISPDSFSYENKNSVLSKFLTNQTSKEIFENIKGTWFYNFTISHSLDTLTEITMSFSNIEFGNKNFKTVSSYSGDSITGQYDIDFATKELKLNFDKPFDSVKGAPWAKNISDTKR